MCNKNCSQTAKCLLVKAYNVASRNVVYNTLDKNILYVIMPLSIRVLNDISKVLGKNLQVLLQKCVTSLLHF